MESKKKYFCKYLPVEGEIEVGDKVESESSGRPKVTVTRITEKGDYVTNERDWYEPDSYFVLPKEKAKKFSKTLFLCSRDIQVGDKIHVGDIDGLFEIGQEYLDTMNEHKRRISYKVIGEISPDAVWVKEGDEFDEEVKINFEFLAGKEWIVCNSLIKELENDWVDKKIGRYTAKVKCPTCKNSINVTK